MPNVTVMVLANQKKLNGSYIFFFKKFDVQCTFRKSRLFNTLDAFFYLLVVFFFCAPLLNLILCLDTTIVYIRHSKGKTYWKNDILIHFVHILYKLGFLLELLIILCYLKYSAFLENKLLLFAIMR